jgi:DNA-binding transcriptional regulator WhiA
LGHYASSVKVEYSNDTFNQLLAWLGNHVLTKDGVKMFIARIEKKANEPISVGLRK